MDDKRALEFLQQFFERNGDEWGVWSQGVSYLNAPTAEVYAALQHCCGKGWLDHSTRATKQQGQQSTAGVRVTAGTEGQGALVHSVSPEGEVALRQ
jgi:hypothetical protein